MQKIIYYHDELNDDFAGNNINTKKLPDNFKYIHTNIVYKIFEFILYSIIVRPLVYLYVKIKYKQKFINKKIIKKEKDGYFLYGNHTNGDLDAFLPSMFTFPKKDYIIVNPDATSIPGLRTIVMMLGALPLPNSLELSKKFIDAINIVINKKNCVVIYPEAHIWPYYNDIRNFIDTSFTYPYKLNKPVYCFTNIYKKKKIGKKPKVVTYIDGPFYPNINLPKKEAIKILRDEVYNAMKKHVLDNPKYDYIKYIYKD